MYAQLRRRAHLALIAFTMSALVVSAAFAESPVRGAARAATTQHADLSLVAAHPVGWSRIYNRMHKAAPAGTVLRVSVLAKAKKRPVRVAMRVNRAVRGRLVATRTRSALVTKKWRKIAVAVSAGRAASRVRALLKPRKSVRIKRLRVVRVRTSAVSVPSSMPSIDGWTPDLDENFNSLSSSRWNVRNNTSLDYESSYLLSRNVSIDNGALRIQAKKESAGGRSYTSGYVDSIGKYNLPNYFRVEVRAKVPFEQGLWAAPLWFRPTNGSGGEIDLVETYGKEAARPTVHQTIHTDYGASHQQMAITKPYSSFSNVAASNAWHTYTIEKVPGRITMWVDGVETSRFSTGSPSWYKQYYDAGKSWNLRINMQIGGSYGGQPDSSTDWSPNKSDMELDYIRTWVPG